MPPKRKVPVKKPLVNDKADKPDVVLTELKNAVARIKPLQTRVKTSDKEEDHKAYEAAQDKLIKAADTFTHRSAPSAFSTPHHLSADQRTSIRRLYQVLKSRDAVPSDLQALAATIGTAIEPVSTNEVLGNNKDAESYGETSSDEDHRMEFLHGENESKEVKREERLFKEGLLDPEDN